MPAPQVASITPASGTLDVVLSYPVTITFSVPIDPQSITPATFACLGPGDAGVVNPEDMLDNAPKIVRGRETVPGTFSFPTTTQFVFTPKVPWRANCLYTVILAGAGSFIVQSTVKGADGTPMAASFQSTFTTGIVEQSVLPPSSPLPWNDPSVAPWELPKIDPEQISVTPILTQGNNLTQQVVLTFPGDLDPDSFHLSDVIVAIEPLLNDPLLSVPANLSYTVTVQENKLILLVGNWPTPPAPPPALPELPRGEGYPNPIPLRYYFEN